MKNIFDIVKFYKKIENENLYSNSLYNDEEYGQIDNEIDRINQQFFELVRLTSIDPNFNYKSLELIVNDLSDIHYDISFNLLHHIIPKVENTPLFRFKIEFNSSLLTIALSKVAITRGISEIYWFLKKHLENEIKFSGDLYMYSFIPPYFDEMGYKRHIYLKFLENDFLEKELYGKRDIWVKKLDEFLTNVSSETIFSLPSDYSNRYELVSNEFYFFPETFGVEAEEYRLNKKLKNNQIFSSYIEKPQNENKAMWFKNMPSENKEKDKVYEALHDIFDNVKNNCVQASWSDFKSIFNKKTVNTKILWNGNPSVLNFIFRHLHNQLKFEGKKWEVITFYFIPEKGEHYNPNALRDNSHYKDSKLENLLFSLVSTLSKKINTL